MRSIYKKVLILALLASCFYLDSAMAMSDETEIAIGRGVNAEIIKEFGVYQNQEMQKYVEHVGLKIVSASERQDIVYHFTILDSSDFINSMSAPGGYVYITKGMLLRLENEAELAAALATEMVHIAKRHGVIDIEDDMKSEVPAVITKKDAVSFGINSAIEMVGTGYSKMQQTEADMKCTEYLLRAGYDPNAMMKFLEIIQGVEKQRRHSSIKDYLRTHRKTTKRRIDAVFRALHDLSIADQVKFDAAADKTYADSYRENVLVPLSAESSK